MITQASRRWAFVAAVLVAGLLAGCSTTVEQLPSKLGGLPEATPARSATPVAFPSVNNVPPKREEAVLTEVQRKKLRDDLIAQRERRARDTTTDINADGTGSTAARARNP